MTDSEVPQGNQDMADSQDTNESIQPVTTKSVPCTWCDEEDYMTCPDCGGTRFVQVEVEI